MKTMLLGIVLVAGCQKSPSQTALGSNPTDRESYGLGYQLGASLKNQNTDVELDVYIAGIRDGLAGTPSKVTNEELQLAVKGMRDKAVAAQKGKLKVEATKNRAAGTAFLAAYKEHEGVTTLPSGLQYRVLAEGSGDHPVEGGTVAVTYKAKLIDGKELASSSGKPINVDLHRVIPGWREAIPLMKEGAKWELVVPPQLAYGSRGSSGIGPESTLVFEVELHHAKAERTN